jgi:hypothetical protein
MECRHQLASGMQGEEEGQEKKTKDSSAGLPQIQ